MKLLDKDIREPLFDYLETEFGKVRIFEEKNMGDSRADIVMVMHNKVAGIEIKSDADSYTRLKSQVKDYDLFFDYNYLVVGSTHAKSACDHVPEHWGIISVEYLEDRVDIYKLRDASKNPNLDMLKKVRLLWRPEIAHIQSVCGLPAYKGKSKDFVRQVIVERIDGDKLNELISYELFERDYSTITEEIKAYRQLQNPNKIVRKKKKRYRRR